VRLPHWILFYDIIVNKRKLNESLKLLFALQVDELLGGEIQGSKIV
jgi:hypothetical protein